MRLRTTVMLSASAFALVIGGAAPVGAQQLIDAGKEGDGSGGLAFVAFAIMVMVMAAALFFMDKVRRRAQERERPPTS